MSCRAFLEMMSGKLDSVLSPEREAALDVHLGCCTSCRQRWELLAVLDSRLEEAPLAIPSADFALRVLARLDRPALPERRSRFVWAYLMAALGVSAVLITAIVVWVAASLWPVLSHPVLISRLAGLVRVFVSIAVATGRAIWSGITLLDIQAATMVITSGLIALLLVALWARIVGQWWQLANRGGFET